MSAGAGLSRDITRIDRSAFSLRTGLRAGVFVSAPLLLGILTGHEELVYTTLGALFLTNTEGPLTTPAPLRVLLVACFTEPLAFWLGTLVGTTGLLSIPLMGAGVFLALMSALRPRWAPAGMFTAIFFAVGIGLPGGSASIAEVRLAFSLLGTIWGLLGVWLQRLPAYRGRGRKQILSPTTTGSAQPQPVRHLTESEAFKHAATVGVVSSLGITVGLVLGLPRDFWIVVTVILAVRPTRAATLSFATMIATGTLIGALMAASITLEVGNEYTLWIFLLMFSIVLYATRGMNFGLTQVFLTPFIIILLNILYPGQWELAAVRILDVAIGGVISVISVYILGWRPTRGAPQSSGTGT